MKRSIYYPGFESTNENWLKFALLYLDQLSPILPVSADNGISDLYRKLTNETDLLINHRPGFFEGHQATLEAIEQTEKIAMRPRSYAEIFGQIDVNQFWKDARHQQYLLYDEKYSPDWTKFCLENGYGTKVKEGMKLSESLATLYLTILANRVAEDKNISPITDSPKLDYLSAFMNKRSSVGANEIINAKAIIGLKLPAKIEEVHLDNIIKLRSTKGFKSSQEAFHEELHEFLNKLENGDHSETFIKKYNSAESTFREQLLTLGNDLVMIGISTSLLLEAANPQLPEMLKVAATASGVMIKQGFTLSKNRKTSEKVRKCRRYLTSLNGLPQ